MREKGGLGLGHWEEDGVGGGDGKGRRSGRGKKQ